MCENNNATSGYIYIQYTKSVGDYSQSSGLLQWMTAVDNDNGIRFVTFCRRTSTIIIRDIYECQKQSRDCSFNSFLPPRRKHRSQNITEKDFIPGVFTELSLHIYITSRVIKMFGCKQKTPHLLYRKLFSVKISNCNFVYT